MHVEESLSALSITIHNDFCTEMSRDDINAILVAVTSLISAVVLRNNP